MDEAQAAAEYTRLFLGRGLVSLHESAYGDGRRIAGRPAELADISGFFHAFGFEVAAANPDLPDHVGAELEFYSLLQLKEAYARERGYRTPATVTRDAARAFLEQHLGRWIVALSESLKEQGAASPYHETSELLTCLIAAEARRLRVYPELATGRLPADSMQDDSFACPEAAFSVA